VCVAAAAGACPKSPARPAPIVADNPTPPARLSAWRRVRAPLSSLARCFTSTSPPSGFVCCTDRANRQPTEFCASAIQRLVDWSAGRSARRMTRTRQHICRVKQIASRLRPCRVCGGTRSYSRCLRGPARALRAVAVSLHGRSSVAPRSPGGCDRHAHEQQDADPCRQGRRAALQTHPRRPPPQSTHNDPPCTSLRNSTGKLRVGDSPRARHPACRSTRLAASGSTGRLPSKKPARDGTGRPKRRTHCAHHAFRSDPHSLN